MKQNLKLLTAIRSRGMSQKTFAGLVKEHPTIISRVINGWVNLDTKKKEKYAKTLGLPVEDIFEKSI